MPLDNISELHRRVPGGKYALTRAVAERARQLQSGTTPLVEVRTPNPLTVAIDEINQGKVTFIMHENGMVELKEETETTEETTETTETTETSTEEPSDTSPSDVPTAVDAGRVDPIDADASGDGVA